MKVKELIELLSEMDGELGVRVWRDTPIEGVTEILIERPTGPQTRDHYVQLDITHYCGE